MESGQAKNLPVYHNLADILGNSSLYVSFRELAGSIGEREFLKMFLGIDIPRRNGLIC